MQLLTVKDVAERLGVHTQTVYGWVARKKLPSLRANGLIRFDPEALARWLDGRKNNS